MTRSRRRRTNPGRSPARRPQKAIGAGLSERGRALLVFAAFVALGIFLVAHHEPWRDEADAWLIARDAPVADLFLRGGYVGSPALWYLLLVPFAKLGLPYATLGFVNLVIACAAVGLLLIAAPFPLWQRALVAFSYLFSYEYTVVARSYALSVLFLFVLAAMHDRRDQRPRTYGLLTALLFNTNVHGMALAAPILAIRGWEALRSESRRGLASWQGLAIAAAGGLLAAATIVPHPDGQLQGLSRAAGWRWVATSLAGALFPSQVDRTLVMEQPPPHLLVTVLAALIWIAIATRLLRRPQTLAFLVASSALLWALFALKYPGGLRHWGFLLLAILYALWITALEAHRESASSPVPAPPVRDWRAAVSRAGMVGLGVSLSWSVCFASYFWWREFVDPFSEAARMSAYLIQKDLTQVPIVAWRSAQAEAVLPFLPIRRFYYPAIRDSGSYLKWDHSYEKGEVISDAEVLSRSNAAFPHGDLLLMSDGPIMGAEAAGFEAIYAAAAGNSMVEDERYLLYRRGAR